MTDKQFRICLWGTVCILILVFPVITESCHGESNRQRERSLREIEDRQNDTIDREKLKAYTDARGW